MLRPDWPRRIQAHLAPGICRLMDRSDPLCRRKQVINAADRAASRVLIGKSASVAASDNRVDSIGDRIRGLLEISTRSHSDANVTALGPQPHGERSEYFD